MRAAEARRVPHGVALRARRSGSGRRGHPRRQPLPLRCPRRICTPRAWTNASMRYLLVSSCRAWRVRVRCIVSHPVPELHGCAFILLSICGSGGNPQRRDGQRAGRTDKPNGSHCSCLFWYRIDERGRMRQPFRLGARSRASDASEEGVVSWSTSSLERRLDW